MPSRAARRTSDSAAALADVKAGATRALAEIGVRLRAVLESVHRGELGASDLERLLGLHKTLCWRVLQVAYARDPLAAAPHLPGEEGIEKFLSAAGRKGASAAMLSAVRAAMSGYWTLVKAHAGDRASFDVMMMSLAVPGESAVELRAARRAGYRSTSYAWGVQTAVRVLTGIITPVGDELVDLATVRGHVRVRRVRSEGVMRLSRTVEHDTDNPTERRAAALPIEPESVMGGVPLLAGFCTRPLPRLEAVEIPGKNVEYRFVDQPLGEQSAITVFTGEVRRGLSGARWRTKDNTQNALMLTVRDPMGVGVIDLWAPPGLCVAHKAVVVSAVGVDPLTQTPDQWHRLPASAMVVREGQGLVAARLSDVPEYEGVLGHCFKRLGWAPEEYELHRLVLEYPVLGSCLVLLSELPERTAR
jgi:hypothetical protein